MTIPNACARLAWLLPAVALTFIFSSRGQAKGEQCVSAFTTQASSVTLKPSPYMAQLKELVRNRDMGLAHRGFLGNKIPYSLETAAAARAMGLSSWYLPIYVQPTLEAAALHAAKEPNLLNQGVYLIGEVTYEEDLGADRAKAARDFRALEANGLYYFGNGKVERYPPELVKALIEPEQLTWKLRKKAWGPMLNQPGWFFSKLNGIIFHDAVMKSKTYSKLHKEWRRYERKGFKVTFNTNFKRALDLATLQKRYEEGELRHVSRFRDPEVYQEMWDAFEAGLAFSIEVWNEKGEMVGGLLSFRDGNLFSPDTVFYDTERYKDALLFAKIALVALEERVSQAGILFLNGGMVTEFTATMKGVEVVAEHFLALLRGLPKDERWVDLRSNWRAREAEAVNAN